MTYEEALKYCPTVREIDNEIVAHGLNPQDFWLDWFGHAGPWIYNGGVTGEDVLTWLGY